MNNKNSRIPENIAPEVFALASRYYANQTQSYSASELMQAGSEAQIPAEFIQQAIQDIQTRQKRQQKQRKILATVGASILAVSTIWSIWTYNSLSSSASTVEAQWAQVENQLQRRADLIPNLVKVTQAYADHEKEIVSLLVKSREAYLQAQTPTEKATAVVQVNEAISRFQNYATNNPQLQSSQLFVNLQYEITGTENRIAVERMRYNQAVQGYNQQIQQFPNSVLAKVIGFEKKPFFQATTEL
ncbi:MULTISPECIES: LemA family protein [unclassified Coleofasciculus]|uniref:LemA family protein n=1 Tax=unclassified Coleofasciculus TaxID=2692782 RepID=UPI00187F7C53|nr:MULTISPECIES: LemA family protein [unclassified Coleofasciculus]MBE9125066.1 LemA family protein [Coleofasciculus sp. LEGE 07081]MBE9151292.1 LemA family protein [Coleofasciculus sp. LEGE 07092]